MKSLVLPIAAAAALSVAAVGCDFSEAEDAFSNFDVIISLEQVNSYVALTVIDGETGRFVQQDVALSFFGQDAGSVIDMFSDPVSGLTVSGGLASFGLSNSLVPTSASPVEVGVQARADGFDTNSTSVVLAETGRTDARVFLFRTGQALPGAQTGSGTAATDPGGTLPATLTTSTAPEPATQAVAQLTIPSGTTTSTAAGQAATGVLDVDISYFGSLSSGMATAFPGGFRSDVQALDGTVEPASIMTAGFMDVTVTDAAGNSITRFDPPIELSVDIDPSMVRGDTGTPVSPGDPIVFFSYDRNEGRWVEEGSVLLEGPGTTGNLKARFPTTHLSTWSAGYRDRGCDSGVFRVERNGASGPVTVRASSSEGGWFASPVVLPSGETDILIRNAPSHLGSYDIDFEMDGLTTSITGTGSMCGASGTAAFTSPPSTVDVHFTLEIGAACPALRLTEIPAFAIFRKRRGEPDVNAVAVTEEPVFTRDAQGRITGGAITIPGLEIGATYTFYTTVNNERAERDILIDGPEMFFDLSDDVRNVDICVN